MIPLTQASRCWELVSTYISPFPFSKQHLETQNTNTAQHIEDMSSRLTLNLYILHVSSWIWVRDSGAHSLNGNEPRTHLWRGSGTQRGTHSTTLLAVTNEGQIYAFNIRACIDLLGWTSGDYCCVLTQPENATYCSSRDGSASADALTRWSPDMFLLLFFNGAISQTICNVLCNSHHQPMY